MSELFYLDMSKGDERYDRRHLDALLDQGVLVHANYEAAVLERHRFGRPKCYESLDDDGCYCRQSVIEIVTALGG